jgi:hypothetical protein
MAWNQQSPATVSVLVGMITMISVGCTADRVAQRQARRANYALVKRTPNNARAFANSSSIRPQYQPTVTAPVPELAPSPLQVNQPGQINLPAYNHESVQNHAAPTATLQSPQKMRSDESYDGPFLKPAPHKVSEISGNSSSHVLDSKSPSIVINVPEKVTTPAEVMDKVIVPMQEPVTPKASLNSSYRVQDEWTSVPPPAMLGNSQSVVPPVKTLQPVQKSPAVKVKSQVFNNEKKANAFKSSNLPEPVSELPLNRDAWDKQSPHKSVTEPRDPNLPPLPDFNSQPDTQAVDADMDYVEYAPEAYEEDVLDDSIDMHDIRMVSAAKDFPRLQKLVWSDRTPAQSGPKTPAKNVTQQVKPTTTSTHSSGVLPYRRSSSRQIQAKPVSEMKYPATTNELIGTPTQNIFVHEQPTESTVPAGYFPPEGQFPRGYELFEVDPQQKKILNLQKPEMYFQDQVIRSGDSEPLPEYYPPPYQPGR